MKEGDNNEIMYKVVSFKDNYKDSNKIAVQLQVINSSRAFFCLVSDVYSKNWLKNIFRKKILRI